MKSGYESLVDLPGVGISLADALYEQGFYSAEELGNASKEDLAQVRGISEDKAEELIQLAQEAVEQAEESQEAEEDEAVDTIPDSETEDSAGTGEHPEEIEPEPDEKESAHLEAENPPEIVEEKEDL
jgi:N utilization substance protein A